MTRASFERTLIIGASSGIGEALARRLAGDGAKVALVARSAEKLEAIADDLNTTAPTRVAFAYPHDVRNTSEIPNLLETIARDLGGLDLVVFAAGVLNQVAFEEYNTDKDLEMLEVNLAGAIAWLNPVAERFNRLRSGTIVGISSVAGDRGRSGNPVYGASKSGLTTYLEALRNRVARNRVAVVTIKPGFVRTPMTAGLSGLFWLISADRAAEIILRKARRRAITAYVPARWRLVMFIIRSIPSFVFRRLKV